MSNLSKQQVISAFNQLSAQLLNPQDELLALINQAQIHNGWFTPENVENSIKAIANSLQSKKTDVWLDKYPEPTQTPKTIALVLAGNIPMVGFHDILCVLASGNKAQIKLSSQDKFLIPCVLKLLCKIENALTERISYTDRLENFDAVIATGSNNSARFFDYYFGKYPHIIRKNRNSVAILNGTENSADFLELGKDIFRYFGMGCRNVSKLFVPEGYDFIPFFEGIEGYKDIIQHNKYANNFDYNLTLLIMGKVKYYQNLFLMLSENESHASPMSSLYFEYYTDLDSLKTKLQKDTDLIQCVMSKDGFFSGSLPFGKSQEPELWDYADGIDTLEFLHNLSK